jgi:fermentation-respiration switch protein FrsA (DUF1100 family)
MFRQVILFTFLTFFGISGCNGVFYQPSRTLALTPARLQYAFENVTFKSKDGTVLNGWFVPGKGKVKGTVIQFHGNGANIANHYGAVYWLPDEGYNVFLFDYRGYGKSEGIPSREGIQDDAAAALNYIQTRSDLENKPIIVYGQSLGGAVAISTLSYHNRKGVAAVIMESSFTRYRDIARDKLGSFWLTWPFQWPLSFLISNRYSPIDLISEISPIPLLIVHGDADEVVSSSHSEALYKAAREPKTLWIVPGGHHIDAFSPNRLKNRKSLVAFLDKMISH